MVLEYQMTQRLGDTTCIRSHPLLTFPTVEQMAAFSLGPSPVLVVVRIAKYWAGDPRG